MAEYFKVGSRVSLKSGSPLMTVTKINDDNEPFPILCEWFTLLPNGLWAPQAESECFPKEALFVHS